MSLRLAWVTHAPEAPGRATREAHLLTRLARRVELHVITWEDAESAPGKPWRRLSFRRSEAFGAPAWVLPNLPRPPGWPRWWASINQPVFQGAIRALERRFQPDALVVAPCWYRVGFPPPTRALRVFDWLDGSDWSVEHWKAAELRCLAWSEAVIAVTHDLARRAQSQGLPCAVVSNGVELERLLRLRRNRDAIRGRLDVVGRSVVSLVGLTASRLEYWEQAVRELVAGADRALFVAVGGGALSRRVARLARELSGVRWVGPVRYEEALEWFVASDATWYVGDDDEYYQLASPLKIFEGLAAGCQVVVAPRLRSLAGLDLPSLHCCRPDAASLVEATRTALRASPADPERLAATLSPYCWDRLADQTAAFLEDRCARRARSLDGDPAHVVG